MSLTTWVRHPDVRGWLDEITPAFQHHVPGARLVDRVGGNAWLIGMATDYAIRFELKRREPNARTEPLVAHVAYVHARARLPRRVIEECKRVFRDVENWPSLEPITRAQRCLQLGQLDVIVRAGIRRFSVKQFLLPDASDVGQICALLDVVPFRFLLDDLIYLNPSFGAQSALVGGADADLICGDRLIDIKTYGDMTVRREDARQLLGYFMLSQWHMEAGGYLPPIRHAFIYFARHAKLKHVFDTHEVMAMPQFKRAESALAGLARALPAPRCRQRFGWP